MFEANTKELKFINDRWNKLEKSYSIGTDYAGEGTEVVDFEIDDNGRITMNITEYYFNNQFALRMHWHERHPRLTQNEIDYLLGKEDNQNGKMAVQTPNGEKSERK